MDKEPPTAPLNAEWYRRKNLNTVESARQPGSGGSGGGSMATPESDPNTGGAGAGRAPPPSGGGPPRPPHSRAHRFARWMFDGSVRTVGKTLRVGGKVALLAVAVGAAGHYIEAAQVDAFFGVPDDEKEKDASKNASRKKRVLVLPFDNLKVVERRKGGGLQDLQPLLEGGSGSKQPTITVECKELVGTIHHAANDPNISALYADFGEGMRYKMGYAHIEEVRNAVRVFNESHRVHREPNVRHDPVFALTRNGDPKPSYAFGHSFQWREYFLASAFSWVHLQARGNLHLFGAASSNVFVKGLLDKYGIKAHIFRHGEYKNAASIFMDKQYSRSHLENVKSTTSSLNDTICTAIENSRALRFDNVMWRSIFDYGSLTSDNSMEIGLVDATPPVDPLLTLTQWNNKAKEIAKRTKKQPKGKHEVDGEDVDKRLDALRSDYAEQQKLKLKLEGKIKEVGDDPESKKELAKKIAAHNSEAQRLTQVASELMPALKQKFIKEKFGTHESFGKFPATEMVPLVKYRQMLNKKASVEQRRREFKARLQRLGERSAATALLLVALGFRPDARRDKIAVVTVDGSIKSSLSYEVVQALRKVREDKDVKAMVLRVNSPGGSVTSSEAMLEEIKLFGKPVICSMSNAAASGGYYIAMNSSKIFALPTTLTGSIGVFGGKFDVSKWADGYGIHGDRYPRDSHATAMDPLTPLTAKTKGNIARQILEIYDYFKRTVAAGRSMSVDDVEKIAQGRVWTGEQAKEVGLVDALGGLERAISYARSAHTNTDEVAVEYYPRRPHPLETLPKQLGQGASIWDALLSLTTETDCTESASVERLLSELTDLSFAEKPHYMMAMDEQTALEIILSGE